MINGNSKYENISSHHQALPMLLKNFKKTFGENVKGPLGNNYREYKATLKSGFLFDAVKFFYIRGVTNLTAIHAWETENNINISYHFIAKIGRENYDSKITIIVFLPKIKKTIKSIGKLYVNATFFEAEIQKQYEVEFES